jgi:hypothetical protein
MGWSDWGRYVSYDSSPSGDDIGSKQGRIVAKGSQFNFRSILPGNEHTNNLGYVWVMYLMQGSAVESREEYLLAGQEGKRGLVVLRTG